MEIWWKKLHVPHPPFKLNTCNFVSISFRFGKFRFVSMNFVSIYFVSFRFVSFRFRFAFYRYPVFTYMLQCLFTYIRSGSVSHYFPVESQKLCFSRTGSVYVKNLKNSENSSISQLCFLFVIYLRFIITLVKGMFDFNWLANW
jgi:hypothetical protein